VDVQIGKQVIVNLDCTIGHDVIIGAGAVVLNDVDEKSVYVGVPAKKIRDI